jgi:ketosteroid isomerase-like protein
MSTTMRVPEVGTAPPVHRHLTTALWIVVGVLAAALVALGAWMVVDRYTGAEADATALVDDVAAAWSSYDADGIRAGYTTDAALVTAWGSSFTGMDELIGNVETSMSMGFDVERIAPVTVEGDYAMTFMRYSTSAGEEGTLATIFQLRDGMVARQWDFEPGVTVPLNNTQLASFEIRPPYPPHPATNSGS